MHAPIVVAVDVVVAGAAVASVAGFVNEIHALCFAGVTNNTAVDTIMRAGIGPLDIGESRGETNGRPNSQPTTADAPRVTHEYNVADVACDVGTSRKRLLTREIIERRGEGVHRSSRKVSPPL